MLFKMVSKSILTLDHL